jgi:hypothetical protein
VTERGWRLRRAERSDEEPSAPSITRRSEFPCPGFGFALGIAEDGITRPEQVFDAEEHPRTQRDKIEKKLVPDRILASRWAHAPSKRPEQGGCARRASQAGHGDDAAVSTSAAICCREGGVAGPSLLSGQQLLRCSSGSGYRRIIGEIGQDLGELVDGIRQQPVLDVGDAEITEIVNEIAPRVVQPADPGDKGHDTADLERIGVDPPAADQQAR